MSSALTQLSDLLYGAGTLALLGCLALSVLLYNRERKAREAITSDSRKEELTNMMVLFHTMRDMLQQQKDLARALNESVEKKIAHLQQVLTTQTEPLEILKATARETAVRISQLEQRLAEVESRSETSGARVSDASIPPFPPDDVFTLNGSSESFRAAPIRSRQSEVDTESERPWTGLDFGEDVPRRRNFQAPLASPVEPADAEAARNAFRALLNIEETRVTPDKEAATKTASGSGFGGGSGNGSVSPLHAMVYEYNDSGMSISQISRELGLGKGEIRLILSLRKKKDA